MFYSNKRSPFFIPNSDRYSSNILPSNSERETGRPRGFAFVEMESEAAEDKAIQALDGAEWMERASVKSQ